MHKGQQLVARRCPRTNRRLIRQASASRRHRCWGNSAQTAAECSRTPGCGFHVGHPTQTPPCRWTPCTTQSRGTTVTPTTASNQSPSRHRTADRRTGHHGRPSHRAQSTTPPHANRRRHRRPRPRAARRSRLRRLRQREGHQPHQRHLCRRCERHPGQDARRPQHLRRRAQGFAWSRSACALAPATQRGGPGSPLRRPSELH